MDDILLVLTQLTRQGCCLNCYQFVTGTIVVVEVDVAAVEVDLVAIEADSAVVVFDNVAMEIVWILRYPSFPIFCQNFKITH